MTVSSTAVAAALSCLTGLCFLGYYVYAGRRKSNRTKTPPAPQQQPETAPADHAEIRTAGQNNATLVFEQEVDMGEWYLKLGDTARSVEHLANATKVCTAPIVMLKMLQDSLPDHVFQMLLQKLRPMSSSLPESMMMGATAGDRGASASVE